MYNDRRSRGQADAPAHAGPRVERRDAGRDGESHPGARRAPGPLDDAAVHAHVSPAHKDAAIRLLDKRPMTDEGGGAVGEPTNPACAGSNVLP